MSIDVVFQVPVIPLVETVGNAGADSPVHKISAVPKLNTGVSLGVTATEKVLVFAQVAPDGVNVYVPEAVLLTTAGLHVPEMPFVEVLVKTGTGPPEQIVNDEPKGNEGVAFGVTVTFMV